MRLALDHITAVDSTPAQLVEEAHAVGCRGICLFMQSMDVLPLMPKFDLYADKAMRRELAARMSDLNVALDLAYPFTLAGRTDIGAFEPALECAAELGAGLVNALMYDRDPARRFDKFEQFCDFAAGFGLPVAIEFYPPSQVGSLAAALDIVTRLARPGIVGVNADLLHIMRAGETVADLTAAPVEYLLYGQFADGPAQCIQPDLDIEASSERMLAGEGVFDLAGFARALPSGCPVSVEIPRNGAVLNGEPRGERVARAVRSVRNAIGGA